jgi:hypothetical protein
MIHQFIYKVVRNNGICMRQIMLTMNDDNQRECKMVIYGNGEDNCPFTEIQLYGTCEPASGEHTYYITFEYAYYMCHEPQVISSNIDDGHDDGDDDGDEITVMVSKSHYLKFTHSITLSMHSYENPIQFTCMHEAYKYIAMGHTVNISNTYDVVLDHKNSYIVSCPDNQSSHLAPFYRTLSHELSRLDRLCLLSLS